MTAMAMVQTAVGKLERRELPLPEIGPDDALLRVEACGICGSDHEQFSGALPVAYPCIPGHEPIGIVAETSCRFLRQISFPDLLHIGLRLEKAGNSSVVYELAVFRGDDTEPSALGRFVHVYVDSTTRRPVPIPGSIRTALSQL